MLKRIICFSLFFFTSSLSGVGLASADGQSNFTPLILGGTPVTDSRLLQATVGLYMISFAGVGFCTGAYIGDNKVVTAGHCSDFSEVHFVDGERNGHVCTIESQVKNPNFLGVNVNPWEDVLVLTVKCPDYDLSKVPTFQVIAKGEVFPQSSFQMAGYGLQSIDGSPTFPNLYQVSLTKPFEVSVLNVEERYKSFFEGLKKATEDGTMICVQASEQGSFYLGDSGGPAYHFDASDRLILDGVISTVIGDENKKPIANCVPTLQRFHDWIMAN